VSATIAGHTVTPTLASGEYTAIYDMTDTDIEGKIGYSINAKDNSGNSSANAVAESAIVYDRTPPIGLSLPLATTTNTISQTIMVGATDALSGIASYAISGDVLASGGNTVVTTATSQSMSFTLTSGDGTKSVTLTVKDAAGNTETKTQSIEYTASTGGTGLGASLSSKSLASRSSPSLMSRQTGAASTYTIPPLGSSASSGLAEETVFSPSAFEYASSTSRMNMDASYSGIAQTASYEVSPVAVQRRLSQTTEKERDEDTAIAAKQEAHASTTSSIAAPAAPVRAATASPTAEARPFGVSAADFGASRLAWLLPGGAQGRPSSRNPRRPLRDSGAEFERLACLPAAHAGRSGSSDDEGAGDEDWGDLE
jgi:hypothetical protein